MLLNCNLILMTTNLMKLLGNYLETTRKCVLGILPPVLFECKIEKIREIMSRHSFRQKMPCLVCYDIFIKWTFLDEWRVMRHMLCNELRINKSLLKVLRVSGPCWFWIGLVLSVVKRAKWKVNQINDQHSGLLNKCVRNSFVFIYFLNLESDRKGDRLKMCLKSKCK